MNSYLSPTFPLHDLYLIILVMFSFSPSPPRPNFYIGSGGGVNVAAGPRSDAAYARASSGDASLWLPGSL